MREVIPQIANLDWLGKTSDMRVRLPKPIIEAAKQIQWTAVSLREATIEEQVEKGVFDMNPRLSWKDVYSFAAEEQDGSLREANSSNAQGQLLRAGIQVLSNGWYLKYPKTWPEYILEYASDKRMEFHAPLHGSQFPRQTNRQQRPRAQIIRGLDIELINYKWMGLEEFENELFEDDQTGQIGTRIKNLGEVMGQLEEAYVAGRLNGAAFSVGEDNYPATSYTTRNFLGTVITGPYSANLYDTGQGNVLAGGAHQLDYPSFAELYERLANAKDLLGVRMAVVPDTLVVSTFDILHADTLLQSEYFAAIPGLAGQTASTGTAGALRGAFSKNVVRNYVQKKVVNRYLRRGEWYLMQSMRGLVFQRRTPMELLQEAPNAGDSFNFDLLRFRSRQRFESDWIDSRFVAQGNDGSAALSH